MEQASFLCATGGAIVLRGTAKLHTLKKTVESIVGPSLWRPGVRLRSIELEVTDRGAAVSFLRDIWGLLDAGSRNGTAYLRGTADLPYIVSVAETGAPAVAAVTFSGSSAELEAVRSRASIAGARQSPVREFDEPGAGSGFFLEGPEGQVFRFVADAGDATG